MVRYCDLTDDQLRELHLFFYPDQEKLIDVDRHPNNLANPDAVVTQIKAWHGNYQKIIWFDDGDIGLEGSDNFNLPRLAQLCAKLGVAYPRT